MYQALDPILVTEPAAKWLTVGDGRYGRDAKYIIDRGCDALASDISDVLLKEAAEIGDISRYRKENAESLSFTESEFDYVFCKEAYHHFPRPMLALYEMLRVANKGVFLIEPNDPYVTDRVSNVLFRGIKRIVKTLLGMDAGKHSFEESGNYVYRISRREIEKVALGLNYKTVAFRGINDAFLAGVEREKLSANGPLQKKVKLLINTSNFLCKTGIADYGLLAAIIFKKEPSEELQLELSGKGFEVTHLPDNPYIAARPEAG
jgi:ubiquinone/menaquinone biosynthesis C-methylase UbiE